MPTTSTSEILLRAFVAFLIYPGFLFLSITGLLAQGLLKRFAARAEGREGPPLLQPFYDLSKTWKRPVPVSVPVFPAPEKTASLQLRGEIIRAALYFLPAMALLALALAAAQLPVPGNLWPFLSQEQAQPLGGDLLSVVLLLEMPLAAGLVIGALGQSVYAQLATARVLQLAAGYIIPYAVALAVPALLLQTLNLSKIAAADNSTINVVKLVCCLLFLAGLPARLRLRPLAISRGETLEGLSNDLNGPPLALFRLLEMLERVVAATLFGAILVPLGGSNPAVFAGGFLLALGITGLVETLYGQVKLKSALRFYFLYAGSGALIWLLVVAFLVKV
jgi:NADH-quinone oxidoreductase subunit H